MTGYEDLDEHGVWREVPGYGWVWAPQTVAVGWAPYRYGHWAWIEPWGWTWVDDAPWGFAPFHYGRWAMVGGGWVWVPGADGGASRVCPALVAFVGGPRFGVSLAIGGGGVAAWFPLGPHEAYIPAYRVSEVYVRQVNIAHVTVTNINVVNVRYVNQNVAGAVTAVPHDAFVSARPVHQVAIVVPPREMAQAQVIGTTAPLAPRRESVLGGAVRSGGPPARFADRQVVVRNASSAAGFVRRQTARARSQSGAPARSGNHERPARVSRAGAQPHGAQRGRGAPGPVRPRRAPAGSARRSAAAREFPAQRPARVRRRHAP